MGIAVSPTVVHGATRYDPRLSFRTYRTAHFDIHAHQGEEALARRLAATAERVRSRFEPELGAPRGRVQVILVDQTDVANGWATPFPYDAIEIAAAPPAEEELIGNTTDWLELVFTHEYTHILHLDRSRGFMGGVRRVFGRAPLVFPNSFLPVWQIEGFATYEESRMTGEGRIPAGDFRAIVDSAARQRRFASIDRASSGLDDWPAGNAAYAYGAYFHQYLSDRFGPDRVTALADVTAGRLPFFGAGAFRRVFGKSAGTLWRDFRATRERDAARAGTSDAAARQLTHHGYVVAAPALAADGTLYYRTSDADGFPALMRLQGTAASRVAWRMLGDRTSVRGDWIVFDQLQRVRSVALYSDLYAVRRRGGPVVRLTDGARAAHPDLSPDGRRIACVVQRSGHRAVALLDFTPGATAEPRVVVEDDSADFAGPRWSPDGTRIVAERRRPGGYDLVLIGAVSGVVTPLVSRTDARLVTPAWAPDGRSILFAADVGDGPFNIFSVDLETNAVRQLTDSAAGAQFPLPAPDGSLVYVGYSADGYDLFSVPPEFHLTASATTVLTGASPNWSPSPTAAVRRTDPRRPPGQPSPVVEEETPYRPLGTLAPTYWEPIVQSDAGETLVGAATAMTDALGRHAYSATAAWSSARARPDWSVSYAYDRWRPTLFAVYADDTDPIRGGELRSRELFGGALLPLRRVRWSQTFMGGFDAETDTLACATACRGASRDVRSVRAGSLFDSRRIFPYSASVEEGVAIEAAAEVSRRSLGSDANAGAAVFDGRIFQRVLTRHTVLAVRFAAASSWGVAAGRRVFSAAGPGAAQPAFDFGRDTVGLLRGFDPEDVVGTHAVVFNADLRVPVLRVQRGAGTLPLFVRSAHAAAFFDAADAWDGGFRASVIRRSFGGELSIDLTVLYALRLTLAGGAAWTDDSVAGRKRLSAFARIGHAF